MLCLADFDVYYEDAIDDELSEFVPTEINSDALDISVLAADLKEDLLRACPLAKRDVLVRSGFLV